MEVSGAQPGDRVLAVSAPIYVATGSRGKAFLWSFLSLDELVPVSRSFEEEHLSIVVIGMAVMALSLWMLRGGVN